MREMKVSGSGDFTQKALLGLVSVAGLLAFGYASWSLFGSPIDSQWLLLGVVTILVVSRLDSAVPNAPRTIAISDSFIFTSVLLFGIWPSVVLAGLDGAVSALHHAERRKLAHYDAALKSLSILLAGVVVQAVLGGLDGLAGNPIQLFIAAGLISAIYYSVSAGVNGTFSALQQSEGRLKVWTGYLLWSFIPFFAAAAATGLIVLLISAISLNGFLIAAPVIAFAYLTYKPPVVIEEVAQQVTVETVHPTAKALEALTAVLEAKEGANREHVRRVQIYSTGLARIFGLSEPDIEALKAAALLHDIGKVAVPDYILNKPGRLTGSEFERMKTHVTAGADIVEAADFPYPIVPAVRYHHERWDGRGYPEGLKGNQIPMTARILALTDCFDSLREQSQQGPAKSREEAIGAIREESGKSFDPELVRTFLENLTDLEAEIRWQQVDLHHASSRKAAGVAELAFDRRVSERSRHAPARSGYHELSAVYELAKSIGPAFEFRDTFALFMSRLAETVPYTTCVLYQLKHAHNKIEVTFASGLNRNKLKGAKMASGSGIVGWVIANEQSMHNCDAKADFEALNADITDQYLTATVVPLQIDGEVTGALGVYSSENGAYSAEDLRLIEAVVRLLCDYIASAIPRELEAQALVDSITGLPNARALRHRFEDEIDRARKHKDTFALLMMDLDGFNSVNESLGYQAGDMILRQLALLLTSQIRSSDFVCRYGSDEFVAILQAGPDEIVEAATRIQRAVDKKDFGPAGASIFIGISVGFACFGPAEGTFDELLLTADRDMRADKIRRKALLVGGAESKSPVDGEFRIM